MALLRDAAAGILRPEDVGALLVQPIEAASIALAVANFVSTASSKYRIPIIEEDAACSWTPEYGQITPDEPTVNEEVVEPKKVAALVPISNELADDSDPSAVTVVGDSLGRSIARKVDSAFFAATTQDGPDGIQSVTGVRTIDAGSAYTNVDPFLEAQLMLESVGATASTFVCNAATALVLARLKEATGSNKPLLTPDPTQPMRRQINGTPLVIAPGTDVADGRVWAIDRSRTFAVLRKDIELVVDSSFYLDRDAVAVRAVARLGFGFPHPEAIVRIDAGGS